MRTLKKALSLVLVLAMVFALAVPGFAVDKSSEYTDYADVKNTEAVDVLTAIGVLNGNDDGSFGPEGSFTRAQAATMVAYLTLGKTIANALPAAATQFNDVPATHWASKFIAYCADEGYISGYGDGKFGPDDTLTAAQWSLMLLKAVKADGVSKIGGSSWEIQTTKLAIQTKIATADELVATFNRDAAAKLALNALFYTEKEATQTTVTKYVILAVAGTPTYAPTAVIGSMFDSFAAAQAAATDANANAQVGRDYTISTVSATETKYTDSLADTVFKLTKSTGSYTQADAYGRPSNTYTQVVNGVSKTIATSPVAPVATFTSTVTAAELYNTLGYNAVIDASGCTRTSLGTSAGQFWYNNAGVASGSAVDYAVSAKNMNIGAPGIITEIYKADDAATTGTVEYILVQIQPTLAKVGAPSKASATATEGAKTTYSIAGVSIVDYTSVVNAANDKDNFTSDVELAKDAYVLIYGNATAGYTIKAATLVEGKVTGFSSKANAWTIAGTSYPVSAAYIFSTTATPIAAVSSTSATYAVDSYGNVIGAVTVTVPTNYVFVLNSVVSSYLNTTANKVESVVEATVITVDGELQTVKTNGTFTGTTVDDLDTTTTGAQTGKGLYSYTIDAVTGAHKLVAAAGATVSQIIKNNAVLDSGNLFANNNTKYFVAQYDSTNRKYTGVSSYTGYANVPSLTLTSVAVKALDVNGDKIAEVVFVDNTTETAATANYVYYTGSYNVDEKGVNVYDVIVKGEETTMKGITGFTGAGLYTITTGSASAVSATTALNIAAGTDGVYASQYYTYNNGVLMTSATDNGTYSYLCAIGADVTVYTIENGVCTTSTAGDLAAATGTLVVFTVNAAHTAVEAIYIVK